MKYFKNVEKRDYEKVSHKQALREIILHNLSKNDTIYVAEDGQGYDARLDLMMLVEHHVKD